MRGSSHSYMFRGYHRRLGDSADVADTMAGAASDEASVASASRCILIEPQSDEVVHATRSDLQDLITVSYSWLFDEVAPLPDSLAVEVEHFVMEATMLSTDSADNLIASASALSFRWQQLREEIARVRMPPPSAESSMLSQSSSSMQPPQVPTDIDSPTSSVPLSPESPYLAAIEDCPSMSSDLVLPPTKRKTDKKEKKQIQGRRKRKKSQTSSW